MIKIEFHVMGADHARALLASDEAWKRDFEERMVIAKREEEKKFAVRNEPAPGVYNEEQMQPKAEAPKAEAPKAEAPKAEALKEEPSSPKPDESAAPGEFQDITYDDLKSSIMKLVSKSPAEMKKVCEAFGLKTFAGTTDPELWAKAKAMIDAKVVG